MAETCNARNMKRRQMISAAAACAALAMVSCSRNPEPVTISVSETAALAQGREDSLRIEVAAQYPGFKAGSKAGLEITSAITGMLFGEDYMSLEPDAAATAYADSLIEEYRAENLPMLDMEELAGAQMSWEDYTEGRIAYSMDNIFSYIADKYTYRGGAHGMSSRYACNFDLRTGKQISEEDFFRKGYDGELTALLTSHLKESLASTEDMDMLFVQEIEPNGNFYLSDKGVTYIYNQYEIAPYSMGIIEVTLPWEEIRDLR